MEEQLIFSHQGVSVSQTQLIVNGKAYAIKDIDFVEERQLKPKRGMTRLSIFGGLALLFGEGSLPAIGAAAILNGALLWYFAKLRFAVVIHTAAGEQQVFISENYLQAESIVSAVNTAITIKG